MSQSDLNEKFLKVGYQRRKSIDDDLTKSFHRKVMGRKGIGKLSIFSIAEDIEIITKKETISLGISMTVSEIKEKIENQEEYHPVEININENNKITEHNRNNHYP